MSSRQFYEEFTGRESLLVELFALIDRESRTAVLASLEQSTDQSALARIDGAIRAYVQSIGTDMRRARVVLVEVVGAGTKVEKMRTESRRAWSSVLAKAAEDAALHGEIPTGDYDLRMLAIIGAVNYVVDEWSGAEPRQPLDEVIRVLSRIIVGAIRA